MQKTVKPLEELRKHWKESGEPSIAKIAKKANVPSATANRYIMGVTKGGMAETIRALAIAMDRPDIAESIPYTGMPDSQSEDYIIELSQQWQEKYNQQLSEVIAKHKQDLDDLIRNHRIERDEWYAQRKALREEREKLCASFDKATEDHAKQIRTHLIEKWVAFGLFIVSVFLLLKK